MAINKTGTLGPADKDRRSKKKCVGFFSRSAFHHAAVVTLQLTLSHCCHDNDFFIFTFA